MTLISSIITDAFREANIIPLSASPTTEQTTEALRLLNAGFSAVYGGQAGEALSDWPLGNYGRENSAYDLPLTVIQIQHPPINRRLIAVNEAAITVYLPVHPQDGARVAIIDPYGRLTTYPVTLDGNGRTIAGSPTITLNTNGLSREWFYRADLGQWVQLTSKLSTDEMPFPADFDTYWTISLAMRLNPRYGRTMDEQSALVYRTESQKFVARYLQSLPLAAREDLNYPFMSTQSYKWNSNFSSTQAFNNGAYYGEW